MAVCTSKDAFLNLCKLKCKNQKCSMPATEYSPANKLTNLTIKLNSLRNPYELWLINCGNKVNFLTNELSLWVDYTPCGSFSEILVNLGENSGKFRTAKLTSTTDDLYFLNQISHILC